MEQPTQQILSKIATEVYQGLYFKLAFETAFADWSVCSSVFGDWHAVTFTPSLPLMLTARIINKE